MTLTFVQSEVSNGHIFTNCLFSSSTSKSVCKESHHFEKYKTKQKQTWIFAKGTKTTLGRIAIILNKNKAIFIKDKKRIKVKENHINLHYL